MILTDQYYLHIKFPLRHKIQKIPVMRPSLGATAPVGLRVAGYNFTAASSRHCRLHSFPKLGGVNLRLPAGN